MSKKSRQVSKTAAAAPPPWLWLVGGGAIPLIVAGLVLMWNSSEPAVAPQQTRPPQAGVSPTTSPPQADNGPRLVADQTLIDAGQVKFDTPVQAAFKLSNQGRQPLQILGEPQVELIEGC